MTLKPDIDTERDLVMVLLRRKIGEYAATAVWETASRTQRAEMRMIASKLLPTIRKPLDEMTEWLAEARHHG